MRGTRWLLLVAILAILGGVGATYRLQKRLLRERAPVQPARLAGELQSSLEDWVWSQSEGGHPKVTLRAGNFRQVKQSGITELERVQLQIFHAAGTYDVVKCATAQFTQAERRLYSEGDVEITLGVPVEGQPTRTLVSVRTSGLTYDYNSGTASTGRGASFVFENGKGKAVGAAYDPKAKELHLYHEVELDWKAPAPHAKAMKLEAGELIYQEGSSKIWLAPWARLTRENTVIEAASASVTLQNGAIRQVDASHGHGTDHYPNRQLEYSADQMWVNFSDKGTVEKVAGEPNARLTNVSEASQTNVTARRVDLEFVEANGESVLTKVLASGDGVVESKPVPAPGRLPAETRIIRSAAIQVGMRPGGKQIDSIATQAPGTMEFLPNRTGQRHRLLTGEHMLITYGEQNHVQSFRAEQAATVTDPTPEEAARKRVPSKTNSRNLTAQFDPKTGQMTHMEQTGDFSYQEGDRNARAAKAMLEQQQNMITLETGAKMWDGTGSTFADRIRMDQRSSDFEAEGHVTSSRLPDKKKPSSELLSGDEPLQAVAETMSSVDHNRQVKYRGKVVLWQGASRVLAERVDIDRNQRRLTASGGVVTQFLDEPKKDGGKGPPGASAAGAAKKTGTPVFTVVRAQDLVYTEENRLACYTGGVTLARPGLNVKATELRAFLNESGADSRMDHAFAEGNVAILQRSPDRTRNGTGQHGEYYTADQKIILRGGAPQLVDSKRGNTQGAELIYFADDDKLVVNGAPEKPAASSVRMKSK
jgi:lipopolysaccharide export system protein LptA